MPDSGDFRAVVISNLVEIKNDVKEIRLAQGVLAVKVAEGEGAVKVVDASVRSAHHRITEVEDAVEQVANWKVQPGPQGKPGSNKNWVVAAITSAGAAIAAYFAGKSQ